MDLEEGKNLFGLVVDSFELLAPTIVLGENTIRGMSRKEMAKELKKSGAGQFTVPLQKVPPIIAFKDINSPESAELVFGTQSSGIADRMSIVFGEGYAVRDVKLQMTSELPDNDILGKLPWWNNPGRPAVIVWKKVTSVDGTTGVAPEYLFVKGSIEPEGLFVK